MSHGDGSPTPEGPAPADLSGLTSIRSAGLDRAFRVLTAAHDGDELLAAVLATVVAETADDAVARSALLGGLAHVALVAMGSLSETTGDSVSDILSHLRRALDDQA